MNVSLLSSDEIYKGYLAFLNQAILLNVVVRDVLIFWTEHPYPDRIVLRDMLLRMVIRIDHIKLCLSEDLLN